MCVLYEPHKTIQCNEAETRKQIWWAVVDRQIKVTIFYYVGKKIKSKIEFHTQSRVLDRCIVVIRTIRRRFSRLGLQPVRVMNLKISTLFPFLR